MSRSWWTWGTGSPPGRPWSCCSGCARPRPPPRWSGSRSNRPGSPRRSRTSVPGWLSGTAASKSRPPARPVLIRAANVLRQYDEGRSPPSGSGSAPGSAPGGLLVEGTCDEIGRRHVWVALGSRGPAHGHLRHPAWLAGPAVRPGRAAAQGTDPPQCSRRAGARLPARLRPGLGRSRAVRLARRPAALDHARSADISADWPVTDDARRWRQGEITVSWAALAPRLGT